MGNEAEYRAYVLGSDGHFLWSKEFVAVNDEAAREYVRQFVDGHDVELWSGGGFIAKLPKNEGRR
jgi:hypothetical protein